MFELDETQRLVESAGRAWCEHQLAPAVPGLERGELPLEKLMRDAKMFEIGGGTNEIPLQTIARAMLS